MWLSLRVNTLSAVEMAMPGPSVLPAEELGLSPLLLAICSVTTKGPETYGAPGVWV